MTLKIISATEILFEGEAKSVTMPGSLGAFTVLDRHASLISTLVKGKLTYRDADNAEHEVNIPGGLADVDNNIVSVCIY